MTDQRVLSNQPDPATGNNDNPPRAPAPDV